MNVNSLLLRTQQNSVVSLLTGMWQWQEHQENLSFDDMYLLSTAPFCLHKYNLESLKRRKSDTNLYATGTSLENQKVGKVAKSTDRATKYGRPRIMQD